MLDFQFYNPTRMVFGKNSLNEIGRLVGSYGKKALMITAKGDIEKTGLFERVKKLIEQEGIDVMQFHGIVANPLLEDCERAACLCRENKVDVIVTVGGGSTNDTGKIVSFAALENGYEHLRDFFIGGRSITKALPLISVMTVAATGSEYNCIAVVKDEERDKKYGIYNENIFPRACILDPQLTFSVPVKYATLGAFDSITHVLEYYIQADTYPDLQMRCVESVIRTVMNNVEKMLENPEDYEARSNLMLCSSIACSGLYLSGCGVCYFIAHQVSNEIEGTFNIAHGAGLSVIMPATMEYFIQQGKYIAAITNFAQNIMKVECLKKMSDVEFAMEGVSALRKWLKKIGNPTTLEELGVKREDISKLAERVGKSHKIPDEKMALGIYELCLK